MIIHSIAGMEINSVHHHADQLDSKEGKVGFKKTCNNLLHLDKGLHGEMS